MISRLVKACSEEVGSYSFRASLNLVASSIQKKRNCSATCKISEKADLDSGGVNNDCPARPLKTGYTHRLVHSLGLEGSDQLGKREVIFVGFLLE